MTIGIVEVNWHHNAGTTNPISKLSIIASGNGYITKYGETSISVFGYTSNTMDFKTNYNNINNIGRSF